jgi:hypothetical protein
MILLGPILSLVINSLGRFVSTPRGQSAAADLIVALGGDIEHRGRRSADLFQAGYAPRVFLAGPVDARAPLLAEC